MTAGPMLEQRDYTASVVVGKKLWVAGGRINGIAVKSTEYIAWDGAAETGPDLPIAVYEHCIVNLP